MKEYVIQMLNYSRNIGLGITKMYKVPSLLKLLSFGLIVKWWSSVYQVESSWRFGGEPNWAL